MNISIKPHHLARYKDIALLFFKYGNSDIINQLGQHPAFQDTEASADLGATKPEELASDLEKMGPTFVKLGQILSSRPDLLPPAYLNALARLQDNVAPFAFEEVESIVTGELGVRLSKAFSNFDPTPIAAASLGQVHRAALRDGRTVVVKVQRPGIRKQIGEDLEILGEIADFLDEHTSLGERYQFKAILAEFTQTLIYELDYEREATNLESIGRNLAEFELIHIPKPIRDYSTRAVLTMERMSGKKITDVQPLERMDLKGAVLADELFHAYLKQVLVDGLFHADPHPGNVFVTDDRHVALLDLGMVGRVTPQMQDHLIKLLIAISEGRGEDAASIAIQISETTDRFDETGFRRRIAALVSEQQDRTLGKMDVGRMILEVGRAAGENWLYAPPELTLVGKTLLQLDQIGRALDDKFNPNEAVRKHVTEILDRRMRKGASYGNTLSALLEMKDFVTGLPTRVNKVLDVFGSSSVEVKVKVTDTHLFLEGFEKVANRIATGLVLAALIIGAALLMRVQTDFQILGYPGFAMLCFLAAAGGGFWLVINIFLNDRRSKRKSRRNLNT